MYAGALSFEDGMKVVKARAEAMHAAAQQGGGSGMASVAGLDDPGMKKLIAEASKAVGGGKEAYIANYLFPGGRTLSGDIDVLDWICANAASSQSMPSSAPKRSAPPAGGGGGGGAPAAGGAEPHGIEGGALQPPHIAAAARSVRRRSARLVRRELQA